MQSQLVCLVLVGLAVVNAVNYECSTANLNIRSGAATTYSINWVANSGDKFQVLSTNGVWHQVKAASGLRCGSTGWAHSDFLKSCSGTGDCNSGTPTPPSPPTTSYPLYKQCDSRWGQNALGNYGGQTICTAGCAMSSVAMALTRYGAAYTPATLNDWLKTHSGYASGNLIVWDAVRSLGLTAAVVNLDANGLTNTIAAGKPVIANVRNGGHWVLVTGSAGGGNFYVNDPGYSVSTYALSSMSRFVVYTPVSRLQTVRSGNGAGSTNSDSDSADETSVQVVRDSVSNAIRVIQHNADGTDTSDVYEPTGEDSQIALASLSDEARQMLRQQGKGYLLRPVSAGKPKSGPRPVQAGKPKNGPRPVQAGKPKSGPRPVQASKPKSGPRPVQASKPKNGPRPGPVQAGKPKSGPRPVQAGKPKSGPRPVQASKPKSGPRPVQASKPKNGPRPGPVQASKPKNGPRPGPVQASKPKNGLGK